MSANPAPRSGAKPFGHARPGRHEPAARPARASSTEPRAEGAGGVAGMFGKPLSRRQRWLLGAGGAVAAFAAGVAAVAPGLAGPAGLVLLAGVGGAGVLVAYAMLAGDLTDKFLGGAAEPGAEPPAAGAVAAAFDAAPDPMLIVDRLGAPKRANAAYQKLATLAGALGESGRPASIDRVLGGHPAVSAAIYRLAKAARLSEARRESLPPVRVGSEEAQHGFDIDVTPLPRGEALWRAVRREAAPAQDAEPDALLNDAPVGFFSAAPDGQILYMNATLRDWLGPKADHPDLKVKDFVVDGAARVLGRGARGVDDVVRANVALKARDGIETPAAIVTAWPLGEGRPASRSVVYGLSPTTAPAGVAQALRTSSRPEVGTIMDAMFVNAPFGVARLDSGAVADAALRDANPALLEMTDGAAAPGTRFADLFALDGQDASAVFANVDDPRPLELSLAGEDARQVHVYFARENAGRRAAYLIDVGAFKDVERQLFQAQKMQAIGQLAGGVAHDLNNLLTAIRLNTDDLLESHPVGDPSYPSLTKVNQTVTRGAGLVRKLLAFAREQTLRAEVLDVSEALSDFSVLLRQLLEATVQLDIVHGRNLPLVKVDRGQIETAIMNLATNARDAMKGSGGGRLTIATSLGTHEDLVGRDLEEVKEGEYVVIAVSDTGHGMDEQTAQKIFEPFFTTKAQGEGTGLGLATVFGIVRQSGGHVTVDSVLGEGTTFRIFLPAHEATAAEEAERAQAAKPVERKPEDLAGRGRILLVEDEDAVRGIAVKTLKKRGYDVLEAADGEEALEILEDHPGEIDLLISDVVMPGLDGPTLLKRGRQYLGDARVVFISGYAQEEFSETLARETEVSFLPKPFTLSQLAERVKKELGGGT